VIGEHPGVVPQHIRVDQVFEIFGCLKMVGCFLAAEQTVVGGVADERRSEQILHTQFRNTPTHPDQLLALQSG